MVNLFVYRGVNLNWLFIATIIFRSSGFIKYLKFKDNCLLLYQEPEKYEDNKVIRRRNI